MEQTSRNVAPAISQTPLAPPADAPRLLSADEWAAQQYLQVDLGDKRLNKRAVQMAARMAAQPEASLPEQAGSRAALDGSYRLLNNPRLSMAALVAPHCRQTVASAGQQPLVLLPEDSTELDLSRHPATKGLGPIGNEGGRGLLLHSTLAVVPDSRQVLGLAHAQVVVREPIAHPNRHRRHTAEGRVWETSARGLGRPPEGVLWIHVSDRQSDSFAYMATCRDLGQHFLVRAYQNRVLVWDGEIEPTQGQPVPHLLDYVRSLPPRADGGYQVNVPALPARLAEDGQPARPAQPARQAQVVLQWTQAKIKPSPHTEPEMRSHAPLVVWLLRVWEAEPPPGAEPVEWVLISSLPITCVADAHRAVDWYTCRWLCEDYHQCLKTGCRVEQSQLDDGADIQRLLGFCCPIAVRLLQLRQTARQEPNVPATAVVEPLMVQVLALRRPRLSVAMTIGEFWQAVAALGGHLGRRSDGAPGWRTLWRGWRKLSDLTEGARLWQRAPEQNKCSP
jgi:hypothetical protein